MVLLLLLVFISATYGASFDSKFEFGLRYDNINHGKEEERIQERIKIHATSNLNEKWKLKGYIGTGKNYTSAWSTAYSFKDSAIGDQNLNFRQLFAEYQMDKRVFFEMGIIPPIKEYSHTNLKPDGWVEGGAFNYRERKFLFNLSAGSLNDVDNPNPWNRTRVFNYVKGKGKYLVSPYLNVYGSLASLDEDQYLQWEFKLFPFPQNKMALDFTLEALVNLDNGEKNGSTALNIFPLVAFKEEYKDLLNLQLAYYNIAQNIGQLGTLSDDFYRYGSSVSYQATGKFTAHCDFSWQARYWDNDEPRFIFAILYKPD